MYILSLYDKTISTNTVETRIKEPKSEEPGGWNLVATIL